MQVWLNCHVHLSAPCTTFTSPSCDGLTQANGSESYCESVLGKQRHTLWRRLQEISTRKRYVAGVSARAMACFAQDLARRQLQAQIIRGSVGRSVSVSGASVVLLSDFGSQKLLIQACMLWMNLKAG